MATILRCSAASCRIGSSGNTFTSPTSTQDARDEMRSCAQA
jgi:hypothetical protein